MKIIIDLGHAYKTDAVGIGGLRERDVCSHVGDLIVAKLRSLGHTADIVDFPKESNADDLRKATAAINAGGYDLCVSLHCDSSKNAEAHGAHVCYYSSKGKKLASAIAFWLCSLMPGRADEIVWRPLLYILRKTRCVTVLAELGFVTHEGDAAKLRAKHQELADAIVEGILEYIGH